MNLFLVILRHPESDTYEVVGHKHSYEKAKDCMAALWNEDGDDGFVTYEIATWKNFKEEILEGPSLAGVHTARITDYGITLNKDKIPSAIVMLDFHIGDLKHSLTWFGSFKPLQPGKEKSAADITCETLVKMGLTVDPVNLADGPRSGVLNMDQDYEMKVFLDSYQGKENWRIKWISIPGEGGIDRIAKGEAVNVFQGMNLGGVVVQEVNKRKAKLAGKPTSEAASQTSQTTTQQTEKMAYQQSVDLDIPF